MIDKHGLKDVLNKVNSIMAEHNLSGTICNELNNISASIDEYGFRVLMIGGFSSGKSAFLNTLLGRGLLKEAQAPETTIATELRYDTTEYIEAFDSDPRSMQFEIGAIPDVIPDEWRYLVYHVDAPFLRSNPDVIFVDMPGIDSNLEVHNKAIAQYIPKGSAYILLVNCTDGTLKKSTEDFLGEVTQYPKSLVCFASMTDLRTAEDVAKVCVQIEAEIKKVYGSQIPVIPISVYDQDFIEKASHAVSQFNPQDLFEKKYTGEINALISLGKSVLQTTYDAQELDVSAIDRKICELESTRTELKNKLDREKAQIAKKYSKQVIPAILSDLERALESRVDQLTTALTVSHEAFNASINSIIRSTLYTSTEQHIENSFDEFVDSFDLSFLDESNEELKAAILEGLHLVSSYITQHRDDDQPFKENSNAESMKKAYSGVAATIAITTDFINPLIELVIVFLPAILDLFAGINRQAQFEDLKRKVQLVVVPEIVSKLTPQIEKAVCETRDAMIAEVECKMKTIFDAQENTLRKCIEEKTSLTENFEIAQAKIKDGIIELEALRR